MKGMGTGLRAVVRQGAEGLKVDVYPDGAADKEISALICLM